MASRLLTGFTLGLVVGILLAPEKGSDTRKKLTQKGVDLKNKFNDFIDSLSDKAEEVKDDLGDVADRTAQRARSMANQATGNSWNG